MAGELRVSLRDPSAWRRAPGVRAVLAGALVLSLTLAAAFLAVDRLHASPAAAVEHPAHPVSDQQTEAEVVEQAKRLVAVAGLQQATAGYLLLSCKDRDSPPYQGVVYLNFALPAAHPDTSFAGIFEHIAATLAAHGWQQGRPPNHMFGKTLSKDGVTAVIYRDDDQPGVGVVRLYGQCRDTTDHRTDTTGWADVTAQIR